MLSLGRRLTPVARKPRNPKTITKKPRKPQLKKIWANTDVPQTYTK